MSLADDLNSAVKEILNTVWDERNGTTVPEATDLSLGNEGVHLEGAVLYSDLAASSALVGRITPIAAANIYKAFLLCAAKIINSEGGYITAYDGDRVMAVFLGDSKRTTAVQTGLRINWAVEYVVNPLCKERYNDYATAIGKVRGVTGIDCGKLLVARTGVRKANDLVWIGQAANYAAKLSAIRDGEVTTWISENVYTNMDGKFKVYEGSPMWTEYIKGGRKVFGSTYWWRV